MVDLSGGRAVVRSSGGSPSDAIEIEEEPVVNNIIDLASITPNGSVDGPFPAL